MFHSSLIVISDVTRNLAYLDPGTGSVLIQLILATLLGAGIFIRAQWSRIKGWFKKPENKDENKNEQ